MSEDCLVLNVFTPHDATAASKLPVMMFIHGGQFIDGFCGGILYDGENLVNRTGVVVVTIQCKPAHHPSPFTA